MQTKRKPVSAPSTNEWAQEEFGSAPMGHLARTKRAVQMAQRMAEQPSGLLTQMFSAPKEREGAYRALENPAFKASDLNEASTRAAVSRAADYQRVYIPVDKTSLTLLSSPAKGLGAVGNKRSRNRGIHVHHALVVGDDGQVLGVGHQRYFRRRRRGAARTREQRRKLPLSKKETRFWLTCIQKTEAAFEAEGIDTQRCYLLDRGGDFKEMLSYAAGASHAVIVRSSWNRRLKDDGLREDPKRYLFDELSAAPIAGRYGLQIPPGPKRKGRHAELAVQVKRCFFRLEDRHKRTVEVVPMWVVRVQEISRVPEGDTPIEWRLITNRPVRNFSEAMRVVYGYTQRWRIEEMHRCWKSVCGVEKTRLRSVETIVKFATIMASVATRVEHLKTVARAEPDAPATRLFSAAELKAITVLRFEPGTEPKGHPTAGEAVQWVAQIGGYLGPQNGPPGAETIARGMYRIQGGVQVLVRMGWSHDPPWPIETFDQ